MDNIRTDTYLDHQVLEVVSRFVDMENLNHIIDIDWIRKNMQFDLPRKGLNKKQYRNLKYFKEAYEGALTVGIVLRECANREEPWIC